MAITIREVAKEAGVSTAAVSKVLHGRGSSVRVSEERAKVIREVAERLQYRPNALARNLRSSRTHTVGLIFENFWNISGGPLYYMHLLDGVASPLFNNHYRLTILPEIPDEDLLQTLGDGQLEGVIWCKLARDETTSHIIESSPIPIVAMNTPEPVSPGKAVYVSCDNEGGIELAVDYLWSLGHRRIAFLNESEERLAPDCVARRQGFVNAVSRRGIDTPDDLLLSWEWEITSFSAWWNETTDRPTAIVCWSERAAAQLLLRASEAGVQVPNELSVVGFDSTQFCETTSPRLTAVKQPIFQMARYASETLLELIRGNQPDQIAATFPCAFDVRDSTAAPPQAAVQK